MTSKNNIADYVNLRGVDQDAEPATVNCLDDRIPAGMRAVALGAHDNEKKLLHRPRKHLFHGYC
jgi:hypothetical protein